MLDGGYQLSAGAPTDGELHSALRSVTNLSESLPEPKDPQSTTPTLAQGVYVPSDGESFSGSGIYVMGDASEIQLSADPSGNREIIRITQNNKTTIIVIDVDSNTTTIDAGSGTRTLRGVPKDRSVVEKGTRSAASLYVRGDIKSLHGPGRKGDGTAVPAIDSDFAVTVTAGGYATGNDHTPVAGGSVVITGDLTYETPVVDGAGNPINQDAQNVLGIFASGGNVEIPTNGRAPDNLTVHASIAAFEVKDAQGNPVMGSDGNPYGGRIRAQDLSDNFPRMPFRGNFNLVGGMQATNFDNFGVYDGRFHGYMYKGSWDARYDTGQSPPFYPGYVVEDGGPGGGPSVRAQTNAPNVTSFKRIYYGGATETLK